MTEQAKKERPDVRHYTPTAEDLAYQRGKTDALRAQQRAAATMSGKRVACGILWAFWTVVLFVAGIVSFGTAGILFGLVCWALAALAGWYDYKIWAMKTNALWFIIVW